MRRLMEGKAPELSPVDRLDIVTLMDNYVDLLLPDTDVVHRPTMARDGQIFSNTLLAEHGLSMMVTVHLGERRHTILFDTGYSPVGVLHNMALLDIPVENMEAIVISHGHMDHTGSLYPIIEKIPNPVLVAVHPDAFLHPRYLALPGGDKLLFPKTLDRSGIHKRSGDIIETRNPVLLAEDGVLVTGQVERSTDFETGMPNALMEKDGHIEKDEILDDQALLIHLKGKGLVVIGGCCHAGIINTILYAKRLTGIDTVHAVLGGFHLSGPMFEPIIERTIEEMAGIEPKLIVPMHCTGWKAIEAFSRAFPQAFAINSVGSRFSLTSD
jgi:7,8-dihydropterin-6-yl-methyl-4-(beta-D-ribofuranosyl)aminobenzene 5'-phosphate synthase